MNRNPHIILFLGLFVILNIMANSCESALGSDSIRTEIRKGNKEYSRQNYQKSTVHYKKSLDIGQSPESLYGLGNTHTKNLNAIPNITPNDSTVQKEDSIISQYYYDALNANISNPFKRSMIFHNWGHHYYKMGLAFNRLDSEQSEQAQSYFQKSVDKYKESLRLNPTDDKTRYNLAMAQYMLKQEEQQNKQQENKNNQNNQQDKKKDSNDKSQANNNNNQDDNKQDEGEDNKDKNDKESKPDTQKEKEQNNNQEDQNKDKEDNKRGSSNNNQNDEPQTPPSTSDQSSFNIDRLLQAAQEEENKIKKRKANIGRRNIKNW